jgi:hypothetical protein
MVARRPCWTYFHSGLATHRALEDFLARCGQARPETREVVKKVLLSSSVSAALALEKNRAVETAMSADLFSRVSSSKAPVETDHLVRERSSTVPESEREETSAVGLRVAVTLGHEAKEALEESPSASPCLDSVRKVTSTSIDNVSEPPKALRRWCDGRSEITPPK